MTVGTEPRNSLPSWWAISIVAERYCGQSPGCFYDSRRAARRCGTACNGKTKARNYCIGCPKAQAPIEWAELQSGAHEVSTKQTQRDENFLINNPHGGLPAGPRRTVCRLGEYGTQLFRSGDWRVAGGFDADESLGQGRVYMRQGFAERGGKSGVRQLFRRDAQDRLSVAINSVRGFFERGRFGIARRAGDDHLHRVTRVKQSREAIGRGEKSQLRDQPGEGFECLLPPIAIEALAGKAVETLEDDRGDRISRGRGRILQRFAAHVEAAHWRGVLGSIVKSAAVGIAESLDGEQHAPFRNVEITAVECGLISIEKRSGSEDLIVKRAFQARPADAMQKALRLVPCFGKNALERFQREFAATGPIEDARGFKVRGDKHRVPADVERLVNGWNGPALAASGEQFPFCAREQNARIRLIHAEFFRRFADICADPQDILFRIVMHLAVRPDVVVKLGYARFFRREDRALL